MLMLNSLLVATSIVTASVSLNPEGIQVASQQSSVLAMPVDSFRIANSTMEGALRTLRQKDFAKILIAFEKVAGREGENKESLSLSLSNATVGAILDSLCEQSRQYTYEIADEFIIYVHPARAESDPLHLLDMKIKDFSIEGKMLPTAAVQRIGVLAPELAVYLSEKRRNYYASRGITTGSPGATLGGNMDPTVSLHLHELTVRQVLNQLVLYSVQLRDKIPADVGGNKLAPTSWMYEFVVNPNASTGLGGIPRWIAF
jgi:hypothetical protein